MLLINDNIFITKNNNLINFNKIFNKLPFDMKLKIYDVSDINKDDIKLCLLYLS